MRLEKRKNVRRGIGYGLINKMATMILPFFVQSIMIRSLGVEYAGIKGVFTSILSVLSLTELGVGSAIVFNMYKPIAEDDIKKIGALLKLYKSLYRIIGIIILCLGILITPFLGFFIRDSYPSEINLQVVFLLYLINSVVSYWLYAYKNSLLSAYQRTDVISIIGTIVQTLLYVIQIIVLVVTKNFYLYLCVAIVFTIINNLVISICADRMFPEIKCEGSIDDELKKSIKKNAGGVLIAKICGTTRNTFDSIFVSMFLGLTQAAIYSNYFYVLTALNAVMGIVYSSLIAGIGNSIALESKEHNYKQMITLNTANLCVSGWMSVCMLCLYQPFMKIWVKEKLLFPSYIMFLFPIYFFMLKMGDIRSVYSDAAGLFWQNKVRCIVEAIANVVLNYLFVKLFGVFGILLATIITIFVFGFFSSAVVIFKYYFEKGFWGYIYNCMYYLFVTFFVGTISYIICSGISAFKDRPIIELCLRSGICVTFVPIVFLLLVFWRDDFKSIILIIRKHHRNDE